MLNRVCAMCTKYIGFGDWSLWNATALSKAPSSRRVRRMEQEGEHMTKSKVAGEMTATDELRRLLDERGGFCSLAEPKDGT